MSGIKQEIKWLWIFSIFQFLLMTIAFCQINDYTTEIDHFKEISRYLHMSAIKVDSMDERIKRFESIIYDYKGPSEKTKPTVTGQGDQ